MDAKRGRKGILEELSNEQKLKKLILEYDKSENIDLRVSYKNIYSYVKRKYEEGAVEFCLSYTWWKTTGKYLVDNYNLLKIKTVKISEKDQLDIIDIIEIVEKNYDNKEKLIGNLKHYNMIIERLVEKINKLEEKIEKDNDSILQKDETIINLKDENSKKLDLINTLFYLHISSESKLQDLMKFGNKRNDVLASAIYDTFSNPIEFYKEYENILKEINKDNEEKNNVTQLYDW